MDESHDVPQSHQKNWRESEEPWIGWYLLLYHPCMHPSIHSSIHVLLQSLFHPPCGTFCPSPLVWLFGCNYRYNTWLYYYAKGVKHKKIENKICHNSTRASIATLDFVFILFCYWRFFKKANCSMGDNHWSDEATYRWSCNLHPNVDMSIPKMARKIQILWSLVDVLGDFIHKNQLNILFVF